MTVKELREALESYEDDVEVRIAHQPSWPLQHHIGSVRDEIETEEPCKYCEGEGEVDERPCPSCHETGLTRKYLTAEEHNIVWIIDGGQLNGSELDSPYAPEGLLEN